MLSRGLVLRELGDEEEALRDLAAVNTLDPDDVWTRHEYALGLFGAGRPEQVSLCVELSRAAHQQGTDQH
ncbi:hypothetical protein [Streptomyces sp. NPDC000983]|uniref:hypothetical protein n=1 Tax=Streptomyces sp. NPDC000983 TaxID=3154373 RepID=UPI003327416B